MSIFGIKFLSRNIFGSLDKRYSLKTHDDKPFKLMGESQLRQITDVSSESNMISGNIVEHLCDQLINTRKICEQLAEEKDNPKNLTKIAKDVEQII